MKNFIITILLVCMPAMAQAAGGGKYPLREADINLENKDSLRNGAKLFVNYCLSCHGAKFLRYERLKDLGLSEQQVLDNLVLIGDFTKKTEGEPRKIGAQMSVAAREIDTPVLFGLKKIPDLSIIARIRSHDWLFTYLTSFYADDSRPSGMNNALFENVGMPHVLWELQGIKHKVVEEHTDEHGKVHTKIVGTKDGDIKGSMSNAEFDSAMNDLVNFMVYMAEPDQLKRKKMGVFVLLFLGILFIFVYLMKKEYWKDVH